MASCHDALEQGVEGDLKRVRARLVECQIIVQAVLEESARLLRDESAARIMGTSEPKPALPLGLQTP